MTDPDTTQASGPSTGTSDTAPDISEEATIAMPPVQPDETTGDDDN